MIEASTVRFGSRPCTKNGHTGRSKLRGSLGKAAALRGDTRCNALARPILAAHHMLVRYVACLADHSLV